MQKIDVLVQVYDRGRTRREIVQIEEAAFEPGHECWKPLAALAAAVVMELPFYLVERLAKFGLRPEDKARLLERTQSETPQEGQQHTTA